MLPAGLLDPLLSCRDGSTCLTVRCSTLLDVIPPGDSCHGCKALSGHEWDTALMQLEQRISLGAAVDLHPQRAVGIHLTNHQVCGMTTVQYRMHSLTVTHLEPLLLYV